MKTMTEMLIEMGGRHWTGGAHERVYLTEEMSCEAIGLRVTHYGSGNISSASQRGERVSNSTAREMLQDFRGTYYDVHSGKFVGSHYGVAAALRDRLAALEGTP